GDVAVDLAVGDRRLLVPAVHLLGLVDGDGLVAVVGDQEVVVVRGAALVGAPALNVGRDLERDRLRIRRDVALRVTDDARDERLHPRGAGVLAVLLAAAGAVDRAVVDDLHLELRGARDDFFRLGDALGVEAGELDDDVVVLAGRHARLGDALLVDALA